MIRGAVQAHQKDFFGGLAYAFIGRALAALQQAAYLALV
jgi:hypothetical protein